MEVGPFHGLGAGNKVHLFIPRSLLMTGDLITLAASCACNLDSPTVMDGNLEQGLSPLSCFCWDIFSERPEGS